MDTDEGSNSNNNNAIIVEFASRREAENAFSYGKLYDKDTVLEVAYHSNDS